MGVLEQVPEQLALEIYDKAAGTSITEVPRDIGYRRNNITIHVNSGLGLFGRKIINACFYVAKPYVLERDLHEVSLDYFKWLCKLENSNNHSYLKRELTKVQQTLIQINIIDPEHPDRDFWHSIPFISSFTIKGSKLYFRLPEELRRPLHDPRQYTYLSLRIINYFTSEYALTLYERLASWKYLGKTHWMTVDEFRQITNTQDQKSYDEFKFLRARVLNPAVKQINEYSDIRVKVEVKREGKRISHLRFWIEDNPDGKYKQSLHHLENLEHELAQILKNEFGLSAVQIAEVLQQYNRDYIVQKIEFVRARIRNNRVRKVSNPGLYLLKALKEDFSLSQMERERSSPRLEIEKLLGAADDQEEAPAEPPVNAAVTWWRDEASLLEAWEALPKPKRDDIHARFKASPEYGLLKGVSGLNLRRLDLSKSLVRMQFLAFLQRERLMGLALTSN